MNTRERFLEVMNFNTDVRTLKWEFGYWGDTINNWYAQGLPKVEPPKIPSEVTTPTSTLYTAAWTYQDLDRLPAGFPVMAGGLYWPTQGFALDNDVRRHFKMDTTQVMADVNLLFEPLFDVQVVEETDERFTYVDIDGVKRTFLKIEATIPTTLEGPIDGWESWNKLKEERLSLKNIAGRFPKSSTGTTTSRTWSTTFSIRSPNSGSPSTKKC
jgi:uroporphyrinogen decarboxylase